MLFRNLLLVDFPRAVRREWRMVLIAMLAFWGTALVVGISTYVHPDLTWMWIDPSEAEQYRSMYQPAMQKLGRNGTSGDIQMFGFYIWNNVSIGFRTFAGGLFLGIPALISLASNGVNLGVVGSVLTRDAQTREPFWSFVITHSSFEITGLVLTGAAGLILGLSLLAPKSLPRKQSLIQAGKRTLPILVGASLMVVLAAFFEAFWSAQTNVTPLVKYIVGGSCWSLMTLWFVLAGRSHEA
jgi:uncharacterized membrane protein SpoIIM required for sporulation